MSGRPAMNPSERPVSRMPVLLSSIARRAARTRSTASAKSKSGFASSPVESSIESPAMPVAVAAVTFAATAAGSIAKPPSKSALTGTFDGLRDGAQVGERLRERHMVVALAERPREPGAGRRERRKSELLEQARAAGIPWIRDHEAAGSMQLPEGAAAIGGTRLHIEELREADQRATNAIGMPTNTI